MEFSSYLFKNGIYAQAIRYPAVPYNKARIRMSITSRLTRKHITNIIDILEKAKRKFQIL